MSWVDLGPTVSNWTNYRSQLANDNPLLSFCFHPTDGSAYIPGEELPDDFEQIEAAGQLSGVGTPHPGRRASSSSSRRGSGTAVRSAAAASPSSQAAGGSALNRAMTAEEKYRAAIRATERGRGRNGEDN